MRISKFLKVENRTIFNIEHKYLHALAKLPTVEEIGTQKPKRLNPTPYCWAIRKSREFLN